MFQDGPLLFFCFMIIRFLYKILPFATFRQIKMRPGILDDDMASDMIAHHVGHAAYYSFVTSDAIQTIIYTN